MLNTARLLLRPMREDDAEALLRVFADPMVMASFGGTLFDRSQMERWVGRNLDHQERHGYGLFSIILRESGLLIGDCGLEFGKIGAGPDPELGYDLASAYWGRGLATEAACAVHDDAFTMLELPRLISLIRQDNTASRRVSEKVGMHLEQEIERHGRPYWLFALSREEFKAREQAP